MNRARRVAIGLGGLVGLVLASSLARAEVVTGPCSAVTDPGNAPSTDPRVDHLVVDGVKVNVVVPPGYRASHRRYPVLYLFHGAFSDEDSFTTQTDVLSFTAGLRDEEQAILVTPDGGYLPAGRDWVDGTHPQETFVMGTLLPFVDAHYRTIEDRAFRAAAGFSAGGMNAMVFAARHPDQFVAAGSFSGFVDPIEPSGIGVVQQFATYDDQLCGANVSWLSLWGDPVQHPMGWEGHDPVYLAPSLEDVSLYIASGNGVACPGPAPDPFLEFAESVVYQMSQTLDASLTSAGIRHTTRFASCGVHLFSNANADLPQFWPQMLRAFGRPAPQEFDYRTGDATASVWGWTFGADPSRAPEFLDVRRASGRGLTLSGSGQTSVVTGPLFRPNEEVVVEGAGACSMVVRADDAGQLAFRVDLGPAHALEQDTAAELTAAAADPHYVTTRAVAFRPLGDR